MSSMDKQSLGFQLQKTALKAILLLTYVAFTVVVVGVLILDYHIIMQMWVAGMFALITVYGLGVVLE